MKNDEELEDDTMNAIIAIPYIIVFILLIIVMAG